MMAYAFFLRFSQTASVCWSLARISAMLSTRLKSQVTNLPVLKRGKKRGQTLSCRDLLHAYCMHAYGIAAKGDIWWHTLTRTHGFIIPWPNLSLLTRTGSRKGMNSSLLYRKFLFLDEDFQNLAIDKPIYTLLYHQVITHCVSFFPFFVC